MATGNFVGPWSEYAAVCNYSSYKDNGNGTYTVTFSCYIAVKPGTNGFQGTNVATNWAGTVSLYKENTGWGSASVTVSYGQTASFTATASYTSGTGTPYFSSATASYTYTPTYTVSYNANGGSGAPSSQTKTYGKTLTLSTTIPKRTGYGFKGWATTSTGAVAYKAGASYTANAGVTLYAVWEANTYTITLNPNQGTISTSSVKVTYNSSTNSKLTVFPTKVGCGFLGWYTSAKEGEGVQVYNANGQCTNEGTYWSGSKYIYLGNITLYAHWKFYNVGYYKVNGKYVLCNVYGKENGQWVPKLAHGKINGAYELCGASE